MIRRRLAVAIAALLALLLTAGEGGWLSAARTFAAIVPAESVIRQIDGSAALDNGNDGRLTVLLLGSDARGGGIDRTDAITIVSLSGKSVTAVSIPRDMARIPLPGGGTHQGKINALVSQYARTRSVNDALAEFEKVVEHFLAIEIDYHALIKFNGFDELVGEIEPVKLRVSKEVRDGKLHDDPNRPPGVYFPVAASYELYQSNPSGPPRCNGYWQDQSGPIAEAYWCHRALMFARTRKGPNNSDFARGQRHQDLVMAAIKRVIERGPGSKLDSLRAAAGGQVSARQLYTNIPLTAANALELYNRLDGASLDFAEVFRPSTYASSVPGGTAFQPKLEAIRAYTKLHMGGGGGSVPKASPTPTVQPTGSAGATTSHAPQSTANPTPTGASTGTTDTTATPTTALPAQTPTAEPTAEPSAGGTASAGASSDTANSPSPGAAGPSDGPTGSPTAVAGVVATDPATSVAPIGPVAAAPSDTGSSVTPVILLVVVIGALGAAVALLLLVRPRMGGRRPGRGS